VRWLNLLFAFQQALWIDVPFVQQDKNGCGAAVIWMVLEYWNAGAAAPVEDIQQRLYSAAAGGIFTQDMVRYFEAQAYRAFVFRAEWEDLEQHISKGRPLIVCLERNARGVPLHYVVVAGIDPVQNLVLVNDPAQRKLLSMSRSEFERGWRATDNWTLLAVPEIDLASKAFRDENLSEASEHLASALRVNPSDAYTNNFLATVYFLQNNNEAALKYWNRAGKPTIQNIRIDPPLRIDPILLDRAFTFSRGSTLTLRDFETTQARLDGLRVFSRFRMELSPAEDETFAVTFRAAERNGANMLSWLRGLPFQTVQPGFTNIRGKALNMESLFRWDPDKRRASVFIQTPLKGDPKWSIRLRLDGREENWVDPSRDFRVRKIEAAAEIHSVPTGRWNWTSGAAVSTRHFSNSLSGGAQLKYMGSLARTILRDPARRLNIESVWTIEAGKLFSANRLRFAKVASTLSLRWREATTELRLGRAIGRTPFDEAFLIGLDRDSNLWLRGHSATLGGRKNAANITRAFAVTNSDFQKKVLDRGWFSLSAGPFLDTQKSSISPRWLADTGIELRFGILQEIGAAISYGHGLRDGRHALFVRVSK
jgi:predicted double-glycine peptidase